MGNVEGRILKFLYGEIRLIRGIRKVELFLVGIIVFLRVEFLICFIIVRFNLGGGRRFLVFYGIEVLVSFWIVVVLNF